MGGGGEHVLGKRVESLLYRIGKMYRATSFEKQTVHSCVPPLYSESQPLSQLFGFGAPASMTEGRARSRVFLFLSFHNNDRNRLPRHLYMSTTFPSHSTRAEARTEFVVEVKPVEEKARQDDCLEEVDEEEEEEDDGDHRPAYNRTVLTVVEAVLVVVLNVLCIVAIVSFEADWMRLEEHDWLLELRK